MFKIPAVPAGIPMAYKWTCYGRDGESLVPLSLDKIERIRSQIKKTGVQGVWILHLLMILILLQLRLSGKDTDEDIQTWQKNLTAGTTERSSTKQNLQAKSWLRRLLLLLLWRDEASVFIDNRIDPKIRLLIKDEHAEASKSISWENWSMSEHTNEISVEGCVVSIPT